MLCNPDVCLDPSIPAPERALDDCPSIEEVQHYVTKA